MLHSFNQRYYIENNGKHYHFFHIEAGVCTFFAPSQEHQVDLISFLDECQHIFLTECVHTFKQISFFLEAMNNAYLKNKQYKTLNSVEQCRFFQKHKSIDIFKTSHIPNSIQKYPYKTSLSNTILLNYCMKDQEPMNFLFEYGYYHLFGYTRSEYVDLYNTKNNIHLVQYIQQQYPQLFKQYEQQWNNIVMLMPDMPSDEICHAWHLLRSSQNTIITETPLYLE